MELGPKRILLLVLAALVIALGLVLPGLAHPDRGIPEGRKVQTARFAPKGTLPVTQLPRCKRV